MRLALLLVVCLGCAGERGHGPSWPKLTVKDVDGGESLAPHTATTVSVERGADIDSARSDDDIKPAASKPAASSDAPASTPATPSSSTPDEPITTEDIVIEIDD